MLPFNVRKPSADRGFTLAEMLTVLALIGIGSVLVTPNLLSWLNRQRVSSATDLVQGAMQDAQRQAIRLGSTCVLRLEGALGTSPITYNRLAADQIGCLVATANSQALTLPNEIRMVTNLDSNDLKPGNGTPEISFSFRGHVANTFGSAENFPLIVIYPTPDNSSTPYPNQLKRCVVVASLLGAIRTGIYTGSLTDLKADQCQTNVEGVRS